MPDDRKQRTHPDLPVKRNRNGYRPAGNRPLHHTVAAAPPDLHKAVALENHADIAAGKDP